MNIYKKTFIIFTLLYVLFFVKTWGSVGGNIYSHDDIVYYAQTVSLVDDFDVDIQNNLGERYKNLYLSISPQTNKMMTYQPLGPSLLYLVPYICVKPLVFLISALRGVSYDAYDPIFFVVLCLFILAMFFWAGVLLKKTLKMFFDQSLSELATVLVLWGTILPVYVFRRPIFGAMPEFFLVSLLFYLLVKTYKDKRVTIIKSMGLGLVFSFLVITRWNDIYLLPICFASLVYSIRKNNDKKVEIKNILLCGGSFLLVFISFSLMTQGLVWVSIYGSISNALVFYREALTKYLNYGGNLTTIEFLKENIKNFMHIIFGIDWGVVFTMPILVFGIIPFIFKGQFKIFSRRYVQAIFLSLLFFIPFCVVLKWGNTGEFYGYRFLISLLPFSAFGFCSLFKRSWQKHKKVFAVIVLCFCIINFFIILPFEYAESTTLHPNITTPMGGGGWGNNAYVINSAKLYFTSGLKDFIGIFSRGYLAAIVFGVLSLAGMDLVKFSQKAKSYFTVTGYRQYIVFFYLLAIVLWVCIDLIRRRKDKV